MSRPRVTLKLATSLDGRIATAAGESQWITGPEARAETHRLRAMHAAMLVGVETVIADDPELTVRIPGYVGPQPVKVVLDSRQRIPLGSKLVRSADRPSATIVVSATPAKSELAEAGVIVFEAPSHEGRPALPPALEALWSMGLPTVMVEGGGQVAASFVAAGLVDAIEWFRAPLMLGDEGRPAIGEFVLERLSHAPRFRRTGVREVGADLWESYERV